MSLTQPTSACYVYVAHPPTQRIQEMALLERPAKVFLDEQLLQLLASQDRPQSLEEILSALRAEGIIHKHDLARSIWRLSEEGRLSVRSGKVVAIRA